MSTSVSTLHSSISLKRAQEWQSAFFRGELGCNPLDFTDDIEKAIAAHLRDDPDRPASKKQTKPKAPKKPAYLKLLGL
jgi:hypothetical protein